MGSLLKEYAGKINLIYIDPPFATGDDFSFTVNIGDPADAKAMAGKEEQDTFHNMNQRYRTRKEPKLELSMDYDYKKSGKYNILVKVIDIFGNDTTKLVQVKV